MNRVSKRKTRRRKGSVLVEALCGMFIFVPLCFLIADIVVVTNQAQANEEFAEQLARLCSSLMTKTNAAQACSDVIRQYHSSASVTSVQLVDLQFDVVLKRVTITTAMTVKLPIAFPGHDVQLVQATATQPIVSFPADP